MATRRYPGQTGEAHPEVFTTIPTQTAEMKPGQLSDEQIKQYFTEGVVLVKDFFTPAELEPCREACSGIVEELAQKLFKAGKIKDLYKDLGLFQRMTNIEEEFPGATVVALQLGGMPKAFQDLWTNQRLLNIVEQLIGPDITGHPVWNIRPKLPQYEETEVPWHQDSAYLDTDSYKVLTPTAWIPFLDATEENGCMEFIMGGHKSGKVATHLNCWGNTWYVWLEEEEMERTLGVDVAKDRKVIPVPYGSMLLFNNIIPHRSVNNTSRDIRWSVDLRWQKSDLPLGFFGLKEGVVMRSSTDSNLSIDFTAFNAVSRHEKQVESVKNLNTPKQSEEFSTIIQGPWMGQWEIRHTNRHVTKHLELEAARQS